MAEDKPHKCPNPGCDRSFKTMTGLTKHRAKCPKSTHVKKWVLGRKDME